MLQEIPLTGMHINYYFTCKRKLWLYHHAITYERESELVKIGKLYHEDLEKNALEIDHVKIDNFRQGKVWELKKSKRNRKASIYQVLFYLFVLKNKGIETSGIIKFKENNKVEEVFLSPEKEERLLSTMAEIEKICEESCPPAAEEIPYCKRCSYYEMCFV